MADEIENLDVEMVQTFKDGHYVVRRTDRPFAAVSLDLNIEQTLMAFLKGNRGLSHHRTFSELNSLIWLMSRQVTTKLDLNTKSLAQVNYSTA